MPHKVCHGCPGTVTITATAGGQTASCEVTVEGEEPAYVDLGLTFGTLWATWNAGASSVEEVGTYYTWSEHMDVGEGWAVSLGCEVRVVLVDYEDAEKKRQTRKVFFSTDASMSARDIFDIYRTRFQLEFVFRDAKQFTGLTHCQARNKEALSFAFNASLTSVNLARAFARQQGMVLSVGSTKTLLHNAAMVDRFIAMSGKSPNMRLNNTDFKELLFYGVRAAV